MTNEKNIPVWLDDGGGIETSLDSSPYASKPSQEEDDDSFVKQNSRYSFRPSFLENSEEERDIGYYQRREPVHFSPPKKSILKSTPIKTSTEIPSTITESPISPSSQLTTPTRIMFSPSTDSTEDPCLDLKEDEEDPLDLRKTHTHSTDATTPTTITIEHKEAKKDTSIAKYKKLFKPIIAIILLLVSGSAAYLLSEFFTIPGLKTQVDRLEEQNTILKTQINRLEGQVDRLEGEVDELAREVDRLANETDRLTLINQSLNQTAIEFSFQNDRLNSSLVYYQELNTDLYNTVSDLQDSVITLEGTVEEYIQTNDDLNQTVLSLGEEVNALDQLNDQLYERNTELWIFVNRLANETAELSLMNSQLNSTVLEFQTEIVDMTNEIDRLDNLTQNLGTMVSFLNETSLSIDSSMDTFVDGVANQITSSRVMAMGSLENFYRQRRSVWNCDFREYFFLEPFVSVDRDAPIGEASYPEVLEYLQDKVLDDMCLDATNFEVYLTEYIDSEIPSDVSFNQLQRAVGSYTDEAMQYYFESDSIQPATWAEANFKCDNLLSSLLFTYYS
mmetsp:Transcript_14909/g.22765  ORF Transcript_14909/g.22765 Transcript_14909/m.22765 type:complete len:560 (+) Transcript_14909:214-1893(+)|eukprot:CAMPEP_0178912214 /NCGR_PEP_ID=MMETSP0786-20121207/10132_1 /TAXON_ID=186022 /ORGANISM="Thalassionema frauenfeldii, Strain CCMP 1798" /LENGTH=559 /DNA_ID=CAMNT_0020584759 /DNA_START=140 /DNA_END=1819 /DNA_ORIENTATION=+